MIYRSDFQNGYTKFKHFLGLNSPPPHKKSHLSLDGVLPILLLIRKKLTTVKKFP